MPARGRRRWPTWRPGPGYRDRTVSRVLNDATAVRPETRDAVLAAIAALGYRRNQAAQTSQPSASAIPRGISVGGPQTRDLRAELW